VSHLKKLAGIHRSTESSAEEREAISLTPWLQPGDIQTGNRKEPFLTVLLASELRETVGNGSRTNFVELDHRAEATVLMRSLRVPPIPMVGATTNSN